MRSKRHWPLFIFFLALSACAGSGFNDLEEFVKDAGQGLRGQVEPVPEMKPFKRFVYEAFDIPSPFVSRKNEEAQSDSSGLKPDLNRRKEVLERYPLESLKMVGSLQQQEMIFALIESPEDTLHRVRIGNHMGQNFGQIAEISESEIKLKEIVQDGVNEWTERVSTLMLEDQE
jgi:type IV pilus assembly protein PilP